MQEIPLWFLSWEDPLEKGLANHSSILGFPGGSAGKESTCSAGDLGSVPGLGRSPGEGKGYPLQYFGLENSMGHRESHWATITFTSVSREVKAVSQCGFSNLTCPPGCCWLSSQENWHLATEQEGKRHVLKCKLSCASFPLVYNQWQSSMVLLAIYFKFTSIKQYFTFNC